jgi:polysaccharide pyruvyl transferase WcaK-like protein
MNNKIMNDKPTFFLIGIGGVYNYGCEAIVRGTELILRSKWPKAKIIYASCRPEDDKQRLQGSGVDIIPRQLIGRYSLKNITRKLISFSGITWRPMLDSVKLLNGVDAVLSIGGDIYTLGSDGSYNASVPKFGDAAEKRNIPYILWGASIGPFTRNLKAEKFFQKHLAGISMISAREKDSVDYLSSIGVSDRVISCADPAFIVAPEIVKTSSNGNCKLTIGVNLSPLSVSHLDGNLKKAINDQALMVEKLIEKFNSHILFVPHVLCDFAEGDDDLRYMERIRKRISAKYQNQVSLLDTDPGFIGTKKQLIECDLVIAARMHCSINAMASHVPTLLLTYSQKAQGMAEYIYGHRNWMLPLDYFCSDKCLATVLQMLEAKADIQRHLAGRIPVVQHQTYTPLMELGKKLG